MFMDTFPYIRGALHSFNIYEMFGPSWIKNQKMICTVFTDFCQELSFSHLDIHDKTLDELTTRVVNMRTPTSAGLKQMEHFGQIRGTGRFAQFDYMDKAQNKAVYG